MEEKDNKNRDDIFSKSVRAGRRTYFFDVRSTRADDYYMTITESKRHTKEDGSIFYQKHKIYLYKEDFASFLESFKEVKDFIINEKGTEIITLDSDGADSKNEDSNQTVESVDENKDADQESDEDNKDLKFEDI
tara:strand:+ start:203 stop:604 length:402 start_codon:yes stop_codon:yes gene_type:complete